ncbi:hypothetical protein LCGC14_1247500 [marine sediment metagenome]|uniref:Uncharacterized protein n=1 Tax=marine sediment metagenome TaxID=412755 RepID=A0A0F9L420_9ZZZZ
MFNKKKLGELEKLTCELANRLEILERENKVYMDDDSEFFSIFGEPSGPISLRSLVQMLLNREGLELRSGSGLVLVKKGKS